ncbi:MAG: EAL domain-containing response regulator [Sphingomonadales bacterium]|nr:EAL domain-containing response regulator [Sphingomonadales bacterium]
MTRPATQTPFRILCVEDEPDILHDIVDELRDHGFLVEGALDGETALALIRSTEPDLVVCDMQLPGMSGLELLQALRGGEAGGTAIPFVFLTAFGDRATMIDGRRAGADDYLVKPIDYDLLIAAVESHLQNARRRAEVAAARGQMLGAAGDGRDSDRLFAVLAARGPGAALAIAKIDNMAEGLRRFAGRQPRVLAELSRRIAAMAGVEVFWLNAHCFALASDHIDRLDQALGSLADLRIRDGEGDQTRSAQISFSIVTAPAVDAEDNPALVDRMLEAARLVQREGGGRQVALGGPELERLRLAGAIRSELVQALEGGELHVCLQPMVRVSDEQPVCAEVLVRWESPTLGALSPGLFIPVIERAGLLHHVTDWVLDQAARCQIELRRLGLPARLSVNVGAAEFTADLPHRLQRIFAVHGADLTLLDVEITETSLITDPAVAQTVTTRLHELGVAIALDDFGTGFSSLSNLQSCAVDAIKIDRSFVERLGTSEPDRKIVTGIVQLAQLLGLETIAEGVERVEQKRWLVDQGCAVMQGYLFARPLRFDEYCRVLDQWRIARQASATG